MLRWSDELRSSGVDDGCTVQINMMRGGGNHRNKKNRAEKKTAASLKNQEPVRDQQGHAEEKVNRKVQGQQEPKKDKSLLSGESAEDEVIRHFEETEGTKNIIADVAEGSNIDTEQGIQLYTELTGLDDAHKKTKANGIRRAVEARRKEPGTVTTVAQEQVTTGSTGARQESVFHRRGKGGARSARMAGAIHRKKESARSARR